ncbi:MAG: helix-turn-helix transcriptional regulator [Phycisphaerae bacterium]
MARGETLSRQWKILMTMQSHRFGISTDELSERLGTSKRTVQRDLNVLRTIFPIRSEQRDFGKKFWSIEGDFLDSTQFQLSMTEMLSLYMSQQLLTPLRGTPFGLGLQTALQKIKTLLPTRALHYFDAMDQTILIKSLAHHDYSEHSTEIATLNRAIFDNHAVRITYHSASRDTDITSEFHPYGLVLLHASLYCIGYLAEYNEVRTLKIARVQDVCPLDKDFDVPRTFSLAKHTHGAFGVFGPGTVRTIRARFTGWAAVNVREMQWHDSQKIVTDDDDGCIVEFELSSTVEFKRWLLGFGRHARVLAPEELVEEIQSELAAAEELYTQP